MVGYINTPTLQLIHVTINMKCEDHGFIILPFKNKTKPFLVFSFNLFCNMLTDVEGKRNPL